jgi:hypothetical protein
MILSYTLKEIQMLRKYLKQTQTLLMRKSMKSKRRMWIPVKKYL